MRNDRESGGDVGGEERRPRSDRATPDESFLRVRFEESVIRRFLQEWVRQHAVAAQACTTCVSDEIEGGQFFRGLVPARAQQQAYDLESRARLKGLSEEPTGNR